MTKIRFPFMDAGRRITAIRFETTSHPLYEMAPPGTPIELSETLDGVLVRSEILPVATDADLRTAVDLDRKPHYLPIDPQPNQHEIVIKITWPRGGPPRKIDLKIE